MPSRKQHYVNLADWRAVAAAGGDAGLRPPDPWPEPTDRTPAPVHVPVSFHLLDDTAQDRQRRLHANRVLEKFGVRQRETW